MLHLKCSVVVSLGISEMGKSKPVVTISYSLVTAMILYNFSQNAIWNFIRIQIYDLQGTFTEIMLISSIPSLFGFLFSKFWGDLSDAVGSRKIFIMLGMFLSTILVPFYTLAPTTTNLLLVYTLMSFVGTMITPALNSAISETAPYEVRGKQIGLYTSLFSIGGTTGTIVGGFLVEIYGFNTMYLTSFLFGLIGLIPLSLYKERQQANKKIQNIRGILRETLDFEMGSQKVKYLSTAIFLHVLAGSIFYNLFTLLFYEIVNKNAAIYGIVNGVSGIGSIIVPKLYGDIIDKIGRKKMYVITSMIYVPYFLTLTYVRNVILLTALWFIPIWPGIYISVTALATDIAERDKIGRTQGVITAVSALARIIGPITGGIFSDILNASANINNIIPILTVTAFIPMFSALIASKL